MNIEDYRNSKQTAKPNSGIISRWVERIEGSNLQDRGRDGARAYLDQYGKGIKEEKLVALARLADIKGYPEFAAPFWEQAFLLAQGHYERLSSAATAVNAAPDPIIQIPTLRESFGFRPHLPVVMTPDEAMSLVRDPAYGVQEKIDGVHQLWRVKGRQVTGGNKTGLAKQIPIEVAKALAETFDDAEGDSELAKGRGFLFDLMTDNGRNIRTLGCLERYQRLEQQMGDRCDGSSPITLVPFAIDLRTKLALVEQLRATGREGFVLKLLDAPYGEGEMGLSMVKAQFRARASVIVGNPSERGRSSVEVFVLRADGSRRSLGNVTIPPNAQIPRPGSVIEIQMLYVYPGPEGKACQAQFLEPRYDVGPENCLEAKLRIKEAPEIAA